MSADATNFISSRSNKTALSQKRIKEVLWYVIECYGWLKKDNVKYSKEWCKANTKFHFEDFLKMEFVDNYLIKLKYLVKEKFSSLEEIHFSYETIKRFADSDGIEGSDKIDIYINKLGLQDVWNVQDEHVYFAIECKRINRGSDCSKYVKDISKFCNRNYKQTRLPFEGMIAFLETKEFSHKEVSGNINTRLQEEASITTLDPLQIENINTSFNASYRSSHIRHSANSIFTIYHLFFNYSDIVVD